MISKSMFTTLSDYYVMKSETGNKCIMPMF